MAIVSGTTNTYSVGTAGGNREDLEDSIWNLYADESWSITNLDAVDAESTNHEWLLDNLAAASSNIQLEGDDDAYTTLVSPTRVNDYCQNFKKTFIVSGTQEKIKKAGRSKEAARESIKKMRELKNDIEFTIVRNQASSAGGAATGRSMASMESWITQQTKATSTASAATTGFSSSVVVAPSDGTTTGALTEAVLKTALSSSWAQGGNPSVILTGAVQKAVIDTMAGIATRFVDVGKTNQATITGSANLYVTSYGTHKVVLHRHVRSSVVLCLDPDLWGLAYLRRPFMEKMAKTGDADKYAIRAELTLVCRNHAASSKVVACA
jgi:hypothetical protein